MTATVRSLWKRGDSFWSDHALSVALALAATVLYMLTLTNGAHFTRDTLLYAQAVEDGWGTFHAQHLAYVPLGQLFYALWAILGYAGRALLPLQVLSVVVGALNVGLVHAILRRIVSRPAALATTSLFALSYGSWRYAVEANPYPMTMTGLLLALMLLTAPERRGLSWALSIGTATALASLFTLSAVLLAPAVLVAFWRMRLIWSITAGKWSLLLLTFHCSAGVSMWAPWGLTRTRWTSITSMSTDRESAGRA